MSDIDLAPSQHATCRQARQDFEAALTRNLLASTAIPRHVQRLTPPAGISVGDEFTVAGEQGRYRVGSIEPERTGLVRL